MTIGHARQKSLESGCTAPDKFILSLARQADL